MSAEFIQNEDVVLANLAIVKAEAQLLINEIVNRQVTTNRDALMRFQAIIRCANEAKLAAAKQ